MATKSKTNNPLGLRFNWIDARLRNPDRARTIIGEVRPFLLDMSDEEAAQHMSRVRAQRIPVLKERKQRAPGKTRAKKAPKLPTDPVALAKHMVKNMSVAERIKLLTQMEKP